MRIYPLCKLAEQNNNVYEQLIQNIFGIIIVQDLETGSRSRNKVILNVIYNSQNPYN